MDKDLKNAIKALGYLSTIGLTMALSVALGALMGYFIDKKFGTDPWFLLIFLGLGIAAAFKNLFTLYKKSKAL